jgi:hypothetical protein
LQFPEFKADLFGLIGIIVTDHQERAHIFLD